MQKRTNLEERYKLGEVLGRGGMGVVYKAYDTMMKRDVAVKTILDIENLTTLDLFYKECSTLAGMVHPNIISIYDLGEFKHEGVTKPFFTMPLLPGATLEQLIKDNSPRLTIDGTIDIINQACRGLHAAHDMGLVHRDVKPSNIFVLMDGSVKIIDFGIARQATANTQTTLKGTLPYMSPEQIQMKVPTPQSDQYALSVVCYEALSRRRPFRGTTEDELVKGILYSAPPAVSELNPNVKYAISQVVHKALAKQAWHRFNTIKEFGEALVKASRGESLEYFDPAKIKPRLERASAGFDTGDYDFASEVLSELEGEGYLDQGIALLRRRVDQAVRQRRVRQLLDSVNRYFEAGEYPLALRKIQEAVDLDPENADVLSLKNRVEKERRAKKIDEWIQLARRHVENQSFGQAREALDNVLKLKPSDTAALSLMADIDRREKEIAKTREKKSALYQAAMQAWERGEITAALSKLDHLMVLEREIPEGDSERSGTYQGFYNKVRSEHDALKNAYEQARHALASEDFETALRICSQSLTKYPNHALFQALNFDVEERQRQKLSAFIAEVDRRADEESDLDRRFTILEEAAKAYPDEKHFQTALRLVKDKRDLVNSIVNKAHFYEERNQFSEALDQWQIIKSIHGRYPGLSFEIERLQNRRDQQGRQTARNRAIEDIERYLDAGNYDRALATLRAAMAEFPEDPELPELEKLVVTNRENSSQAAALLAQARELSDADKPEESVPLLRKARQLDPRNTVIRAVLVNSLLDAANHKLNGDWESSEPLIHEVLELEPFQPAAITLQSRLIDRKKENFFSRCLGDARRLQREEKFGEALAVVEKGLEADPKDQRLLQLRATLLQRQAQAVQMPAKAPTVQAAAAGAGSRISPASVSSAGIGVATPEPESRTLVSPASDSAAGAQPYGSEPPDAIPPGEDALPYGQPPVTTAPARKRDYRSWWLGAAGAAAVLFLLAISLIVDRKSKTTTAPIAAGAGSANITLQASEPGAAILIDGQSCGTGQCKQSLKDGTYKIEAVLTGYAMPPMTLPVQSGKAQTITLTLTPQLPTVLLSTNLDNATVQVDALPPVAFQNQEAALTSLPAGPHTVQFRGEQWAAKFTFSAAPAKSAQIDPLPHEPVWVSLVSVLGSDAKIYSNLQGADLTLDDKSVGKMDAPEHDLPGLDLKTHDLTIASANGPAHHLSFTSGSAPLLVAFIGTNKNATSLQLETGEDDATVYINDKKMSRLTSRGGRYTNISLPPDHYKIRVEKDGFQPVQEQTAELKAGATTTLKFQLVPVPQFASLMIHNSVPGAEVRLGGRSLGTIGADGSFYSKEIPPGAANVTIRKDGYKAFTSEQNFVAGTPVEMDAKLQSITGTLKIEISPAGVANPRLTIKREGEEPKPVSEMSLPLAEGTYVISGSAPGYTDATASAHVTGGQTKAVTLLFSKSVVKAAPIQPGMALADWQKVGFEKSGDYLVRKGNGVFQTPIAAGAGSYTFTARMEKGKKLEWYATYQDDKNNVLLQVEDDKLTVTTLVAGVKSVTKNAIQIKHDRWLVVAQEVAPDQIHITLTQDDQNKFSASVNHPLAGRFAFKVSGRDELMLAHFRFTPK